MWGNRGDGDGIIREETSMKSLSEKITCPLNEKQRGAIMLMLPIANRREGKEV